VDSLVMFVSVTSKRNIFGHVQVSCVTAGGTYGYHWAVNVTAGGLYFDHCTINVTAGCTYGYHCAVNVTASVLVATTVQEILQQVVHMVSTEQ